MMALYSNEGNGLFIDEAPASTIGRASLLRLTFACFFFDADLDGLLDIFAANGHVADDIATRPADDHLRAAGRTSSAISERRSSRTSPRSGRSGARPRRSSAAARPTATTTTTAISTCSSRPTTVRRGSCATTAASNRKLRVTLVGTTSNRDAHRRPGPRRSRGRTDAVAHGEDGIELPVAERAAADVRPGQRGRRSTAIEVTWPNGKTERLPASPPTRRSRSRKGKASSRPAARVEAVRAAVIALVAALAMLHLQAGPPAAGRALRHAVRPRRAAREAAYRANNLGVARLEQFDYEGAAKSFRDALQLAPDLALARLNLAIALFYGGHTADAATEAQAAAAAPPGHPAAHYVLGLIAKAEDRLDDAIAAFTRVLQLDPADAGSQGQSRPDSPAAAPLRRSAPRCSSDALAAEPYNVTAAYNAALALTRAGRGRRGPAGDAAVRVAARQHLRRDLLADLPGAGPIRARRIASTGAEPDLVNPATPAVTFADATGDVAAATPAAPSRTRRKPAGGVTLFDADGDGDLDLVDDRHGRLAALSQRRRAASRRDGRESCLSGHGGGRPRRDRRRLRQRRQARSVRPPRRQPAASAPEGRRHVRGRDAGRRAAGTTAVGHDRGVRRRRSRRRPRHRHRRRGRAVAAQQRQRHLHRHHRRRGHRRRAVRRGARCRSSPTDFDNRRDIDLLVASRAAGAGAVPQHARRHVPRRGSRARAAAGRRSTRAVAAGDVNKDGYTDFFLASRRRPACSRSATATASFARRRRPRRRGRPWPRSSSTTTTTGCSIC